MFTLKTVSRIPEVRLAAPITLLLAWCAALLVFRVLWTQTFHYAFLVWNLGLATMPIIFSMTFARVTRRPLLAGAFGLWLLFFPNAPYIITDFLHLRNFTSAPIWFDILLIFSSAAFGLTIAYISLVQIHDRLISLNRSSLACPSPSSPRSQPPSAFTLAAFSAGAASTSSKTHSVS